MALTRASTTREPAHIAITTPRIPSVLWLGPNTLSSKGTRRSSMASGVSTASARSSTPVRNCPTASTPTTPGSGDPGDQSHDQPRKGEDRPEGGLGRQPRRAGLVGDHQRIAERTAREAPPRRLHRARHSTSRPRPGANLVPRRVIPSAIPPRTVRSSASTWRILSWAEGWRARQSGWTPQALGMVGGARRSRFGRRPMSATSSSSVPGPRACTPRTTRGSAGGPRPSWTTCPSPAARSPPCTRRRTSSTSPDTRRSGAANSSMRW